MIIIVIVMIIIILITQASLISINAVVSESPVTRQCLNLNHNFKEIAPVQCSVKCLLHDDDYYDNAVRSRADSMPIVCRRS